MYFYKAYNEMSDNYQFDKNSKLFQKFLALKANKTNESFTAKSPNNHSLTLLNSKTQASSTAHT